MSWYKDRLLCSVSSYATLIFCLQLINVKFNCVLKPINRNWKLYVFHVSRHFRSCNVWLFSWYGLDPLDENTITIMQLGRSQWPRGLRRGSAAVRFLGLWVQIQSEAWMSVSLSLLWVLCVVCATGRSLFERNPTECLCVSDGDPEALTLRRLWPTRRCCETEKK
jgi:hypothetical protein